ncbi:MAG: DUF6245 family protein [Chloroflexota bacterium]
MKKRKETPSTVIQIATAMQALGLYNGQNTEAEHKAEAARLGSETYYSMLLINALLGAVEAEALHADSSGVEFDQLSAAHEQALQTAGAKDTPEKLLSFLRWRTLRIAGPLRQISQSKEAGPIPLAAAHAAEALQNILSVTASGQNLSQFDPHQMTADLKTARQALVNSLANLDIMLDLIDQIEDVV